MFLLTSVSLFIYLLSYALDLVELWPPLCDVSLFSDP